MPLNLASPGLVVREVDLTIGRVDTATTKAGAIVAPFQKGPVNEPTTIENEQDLIDNFGEPLDIDKHYEYWLTASSYLSYGGILSVVRSDDDDLQNATDDGSPEIKILSSQDYNNKGYDLNALSNTVIAARNPGSWANGIKVAIIDGVADQVLTLGTSNYNVGAGVTQAVASGLVLPGAGSTTVLDGYFKGIITQKDGASASVKFVSHVSAAGIETFKPYQPGGVYEFQTGVISVGMTSNAGGGSTTSVSAKLDWFDQQKIPLSNSTINWNTLAERPGTSAYATARSSRFDEVHVVVFDDKGEVTGNAGTVLEKHLGLSKAKDAEFSAGSPSYWRKYTYNNSNQIFALGGPGFATTATAAGAAGITTTSFEYGGFTKETDNAWDQDAQGISFAGSGSHVFTLTGGKNYNGQTGIQTAGAMKASVGGITAGYDLFEDKDQFDVDFLIMGSGNYPQYEAQAIANKLISIAELRKDVVAFISPNRGSFLNDSAVGTGTLNSAADITDNVVGFYAPITSSSYAVFDSGYKYMFDRFSDTFRYVPLNGDIAGTCARNDINNFPWFSPAGTARGGILNAVKLAYTPNQTQRDVLYSNRINPVIFSPGAGIVLFGDKTGFGKASAFDRINVRRLFIFLEEAISAAARDQLFEFNDEITRTNFVNIVEPFLRDVQSKRGIFDFRVVCDETNNTAAIIDSNEFVADIFIKPARSINFIGLTFVATRTGISFDEVIGTV